MSNLTIVNWCSGDRCDPCKPTPPEPVAGDCFLIGAEPFGCLPVCPFIWESGFFADEGKLIHVEIQFTVTGTNSSPTFTISGDVSYTGVFHYSQLPFPAHNIGKIVGPINMIAIRTHTTAEYGSPFCTGSGYWRSGDCQVQTNGTRFYINVYQIQSDGSELVIGPGGGFSGG